MTESAQKARNAAERVVAVCNVLAHLTPIDVDAFVADVCSQWAVEMASSASARPSTASPPRYLELFSEQPWRQIVATRNFVAHQCDDLELRLGLAHLPLVSMDRHPGEGV